MDKVQWCGFGKMHVSSVTTFAETIFRTCIFAALGEILKTQLQAKAHRCSFVATHHIFLFLAIQVLPITIWLALHYIGDIGEPFG